MSEHPPFPADFLNEAGINRQHVFDLADLPDEVRATLGDTTGFQQLILLGHGGRRLWECVQASGIVGEHPIDDYCVQTVRRWFAEHIPGARYRIVYPGVSMVGLQALGRLAGWHHASPFMVGIDSEWGSWYAYRAVVLADSQFLPFFPAERAPKEVPLGDSIPCVDCPDQPCIAACPAEAMADGQFSLTRCAGYRLQAASACAYTCLARSACPVGSEHRYDDAQIRHSYGQSLAMLRKYTAGA
jgi:epoxyqueuosine reductase